MPGSSRLNRLKQCCHFPWLGVVTRLLPLNPRLAVTLDSLCQASPSSQTIHGRSQVQDASWESRVEICPGKQLVRGGHASVFGLAQRFVCLDGLLDDLISAKKACETRWIREIEKKKSSWFRRYSCVLGTGSRTSPESIYIPISPLHKHSHLWGMNVLRDSAPSLTTAPSRLICRKKTESLDSRSNPHAVQWSPSFRPRFPLLLSELWGASLEAR